MRKLLNQIGVIHTLPLLVIVAAVGIISFLLISSTFPLNGLFGIINPKPDSHAAASLVVTGVARDNSAVKIFFQPVVGAKDYRVYDITNPNNVKYAGWTHLTAAAACPGGSCWQHFVAQADGVTPVFPYQVTPFSYPNGGTGGPQVLDLPATQIDWNNVGDGQPHTLIVEAVDKLGPAPQGNLYRGTGNDNIPFVSPLPAGAMLGSNKGPTADGKTSTNGQGPYTNNPQVIAQSQPFIVQANQAYKAIPSKGTASQTFFDTFDNSEASTITQVARNDGYSDNYGNLGLMKYTMNAGTPKAWDIEYRRANNRDSMPFISGDHFMDMIFDGGTPPGGTHTIWASMAMTPSQTFDISNGKVAHITMEVDNHQSFRRWMGMDIVPASNPIVAWHPDGEAINTTNQGIFFELRDTNCTFELFTGPAGVTTKPTGTAGGAAGSRLWGPGGATDCGYDNTYNPTSFTKNGFGLDDKSKLDLFFSQTHAAYFLDGRLVIQTDIPAGTFPWANVPLKAYFSHYLYHSDNDITELQTFSFSGNVFCYPLNSYWFNDPVSGSTTASNICNTAYPAGYGFPYSDERHWDNMGFEVLPASDVPAGNNFSSFASLVAIPAVLPPQFTGASPAPSTPAPSPTPSSTSTPVATNSVSITNFAFSPQIITVPAGTTVTWTNNATGTNHTVTDNGGLFDSGLITPGATYSFKFDTAGTYNYHCTVHPGMTATVIVTGTVGSPTPGPTATPSGSGKVGDLDNDGDVDIFDYSTLVSNFGRTGTNILGDIDHDGDVDIFDYSALVSNFGK